MNKLFQTLFAPIPQNGRTEIVDGIECQINFLPPSSEDAGIYSVQVSAPQGNPSLMFVALRRNVKTWLMSLLTKGIRITTGDNAFDRKVWLTSTLPQVPSVTTFFAAPKHRDAVGKLLDLGCGRVIMNEAGVSATWTVPATTAHVPEPEKVVSAVPLLGSLVGVKATNGVRHHGTTTTHEQSERLTDLADTKNWEVTAALALIPFIAPAAYAYVGGWRHGLVTAVLVLPFLWGLTRIPPPFADAVPAVLLVALWKACVAGGLRNRLVSETAQLSSRAFGSLPHAAFAAADLFLGYVMALAAAFCWVWLIGPQFSIAALVEYFVIAVSVVWLVELALGRAIHSGSRAIASLANPFMEQLSPRWQRQVNAGDLPRSERPPFLPTWSEALRAIAVSLVAPLFVEIGRIRL